MTLSHIIGLTFTLTTTMIFMLSIMFTDLWIALRDTVEWVNADFKDEPTIFPDHRPE